VEQFRYSEKTQRNQNSIYEEIKSSLNSGNAYCHSVQNLWSSSLLSRNIKIYRTVILPVFCMGVKLLPSYWGRNIGWGCVRTGCWGRLRAWEGQGNRGLEKITPCGALYYVPLTKYSSGYQIKRIIWVVQAARMIERRGAQRVLVGKREGKKPPGRSWRGWRITSERIFKKWDGWAWTGLVSPRIQTGGEHLWIR
jgi:hypothetical protein